MKGGRKNRHLRSFGWIFLSAVACSMLAFSSIKGILHWKKMRRLLAIVPVRAIIQTGPQKEALPTSYLAQILDLSSDVAVSLIDFDRKGAEAKLVHSPVIKEAKVSTLEPGILQIDYTVRQPIALLSDFENVAVDIEGVPFPIAPFLTPKKLPELYLGLEGEIKWNVPIRSEKMELSLALLQIVNGPIVRELFNVKRIDVSNAFEHSCGRREIVLTTEDVLYLRQKEGEMCVIFPRYLRLSTKKYTQELGNYLKLREQLLEKERLESTRLKEEGGGNLIRAKWKTIDFRISKLAFIEEEMK